MKQFLKKYYKAIKLNIYAQMLKNEKNIVKFQEIKKKIA